jgi:dynein assembly factor 5
VRLCTVNTIGEWLLDLPDRYSYHHKLIPLLCTALTDEVDDVKLTAHRLWLKIGTKYEEENEDDLKDKMDFAAQREPHPHLEFPRPPLGCRVLVHRSFSKILPAILRDITDWTAKSRIKSSQLLYTLLYHLEGNITHHIQPVLAGLYKSCLDDEPTVVEWTMRSADVIGFYVSAETWCHLILPAVRISGGCSHVKGEESSVPVGPRQCTGCLMILSCLISGCPNHSLEPYLMVITECVAEPELGGYYPLLIQLNSCVFHLIQSSSSLSLSPLSFHLFTILLRGLSDQQVDQSLTSTINDTLLLLADGLGLNDVRELYQIHAKEILKLVKVNYKDWTVHSSNCSLFASLLSSKDIGLMVGGSVDDIVPLIAHCTHHDQDPEMRLRFITLLIQCILNTTTTKPSDDNNFTCIITDVVIPCCVWRSGR